jgi:hypothetical protein
MELLNCIQQIRTRTGGHKHAAVITSGLHQPGMPKTQGVPENAIVRSFVLSAAGGLHLGISPDRRIMAQKREIRQRINYNLGYSGKENPKQKKDLAGSKG